MDEGALNIFERGVLVECSAINRSHHRTTGASSGSCERSRPLPHKIFALPSRAVVTAWLTFRRLQMWVRWAAQERKHNEVVVVCRAQAATAFRIQTHQLRKHLRARNHRILLLCASTTRDYPLARRRSYNDVRALTLAPLCPS